MSACWGGQSFGSGIDPPCLINQTRAALAGEIAPKPWVLHAAPILQLRQEQDVNKRPEEPRNNSCELDSANTRYRCEPCREIPNTTNPYTSRSRAARKVRPLTGSLGCLALTPLRATSRDTAQW